MRSFLLAFGCVCLATSCPADNWPRFRGPNGSGISQCETIPTEWSADDYVWDAELKGTGHAAPVVWDQHLFVTSANPAGTKRFLACLNTTSGRQLWQKEYDFPKGKAHKNNSHASGTPAVDADHVYVLWQSKQQSPLIAYNHAGDEIWRYDLGAYNHGQGPGTSPIVYGDFVFVCNDQKSNSFLLCVNRMTGKEVWKTPRLGKRACYATPCVFKAKDRPAEIIFSHCFEGVIGVDPSSGKQHWHANVFGSHSQRAVGSPIVWNDLVLANSGARAGERNAVTLRISGSDKNGSGASAAEEVYRFTKTAAPHVPSLLVFADRLYLWSDAGIVTCADVTTGKKIWQKRVGGNFFGSPVCVADRLFCISVDGEVVVIAAADEYKLLARNVLSTKDANTNQLRPLNETCHSTPAVGDNKMFLRTGGRLIAVGK